MTTKTPATLAAEIKLYAPNFFGKMFQTLEAFMRAPRCPFDVFSVKQAFDGTLVEIYDGSILETMFLVERCAASEVHMANVNSLERLLAKQYAIDDASQALAPLLSAQYPGKYKGRMFDRPADALELMGFFYVTKKVWFEYGHTLVLIEDIRSQGRDSQIIALRGEWLVEDVKRVLKSERLRL